MIIVTPRISLDEREIEESFIHGSGPGGQNVNKVATSVQLRFDVARSPSLPDSVRARMAALAGRKLSREGVIVITANRYRSQEQNRRDALERLLDLIRRAAIVPITRRPTRPTLASRRRRLEAKSHRSALKAQRETPSGE